MRIAACTLVVIVLSQAECQLESINAGKKLSAVGIAHHGVKVYLIWA